MKDQPVAPGQILDGKYRVERVLGAGAMGMVLAATHLVLDTRVAIKIMLGGGRRSEEQEQRFLREARVAAMLKSRHAGKVLDVGTTEAGAPYIVMEYLDGKDLRALADERGPLPIEEAVGYVLQASEALAEAHALGIVHRDVKPANLFLTTGADGAPCVKLVDFGVAKQSDASLALTRTAQAIGSPLYMSPEQMNGARDLDGRADLWSLGVTLYELLTGTTPFAAETLMELAGRVHLGMPTPITEYRPEIPGGLAAVIMACFEKDRARRWPNIAALAAALAPYASARMRSYAEQVAGAAKVELPASRPTDVLPPEPTAAPPGKAPVAVETAPAASAFGAPASGRAPLWLVAALLAVGVPASLFLALRTRGAAAPAARVEPLPPPVVTAQVSADTPAPDPTPTAPPAEPSAIPAAKPSAPAPPRARTPVSTSPHPPATVRPADPIIGGSRR
jgi:serine/threonine-protein kinase